MHSIDMVFMLRKYFCAFELTCCQISDNWISIFRGVLCHPTTFCPTVLFKGVTTVLRARVLRIATSKRCHETDTRGHRTEGEEPPHGQVTGTAGDTGIEQHRAHFCAMVYRL